MPEFTLASLRIVYFSLYYHVVVFICNSPNRKEAGKKTRTGKSSACVFPAACTVSFPLTFTATRRVPSSPHVPVLQHVPTDVPGAPKRSQRPRFTARMHSNAGRTRIKISTVQCNHLAPAATKIDRGESASITAPGLKSIDIQLSRKVNSGRNQNEKENRSIESRRSVC